MLMYEQTFCGLRIF